MLVDAYIPSIESRDVVRFLSGTNSTRMSKSLRTKVIRLNDNVISSLQSRITYKTYRIKANNGQIEVGKKGQVFSSRRLEKTMAPCSEVVCFLATAGPELDRAISRLTERGRLSTAFVLDAMGSLLIERVIDTFQEKMRQELLSKGKETTVRFSPGYCDWPLKQQRELFGLLDSEALRVKLSQSCLMTPRKSISGLFGIYSLEQTPERYIPCWGCARGDCASRRAQAHEAELLSKRGDPN